jgi:hypothetical protein
MSESQHHQTSINQSMNHQSNQSINSPFKLIQQTKKQNNRSAKPTNQLINQSLQLTKTNRSINQSNQKNKQTINQSIKSRQSTDQSITSHHIISITSINHINPIQSIHVSQPIALCHYLCNLLCCHSMPLLLLQRVSLSPPNLVLQNARAHFAQHTHPLNLEMMSKITQRRGTKQKQRKRNRRKQETETRKKRQTKHI